MAELENANAEAGEDSKNVAEGTARKIDHAASHAITRADYALSDASADDRLKDVDDATENAGK